MVKNNLKVYLLRHAESYYNTWSRDFINNFIKKPNDTVINKSNFPNFKYSHSDLINDSDWTIEGISDCKILMKNNEDLFKNIKYVFISPLARCWQTFFYIYNQEYYNINKIIIHPCLREQLISQNDIPIKLDEFLQKNKINELLDDYFLKDYNYKTEKLWIFNIWNFDKKKYMIKNIINSSILSEHDKWIRILNVMESIWPKRLESEEYFTNRSFQMISDINSYLVQEELENNIIINDHEVLIVSHYEIIKKLCKIKIDHLGITEYDLK